MTELPRGWINTRLSEICAINPRVDKATIEPASVVSFVPMTAVEAETGKIDVSETREFETVKRKGYTPFQKNDILFAKITPCMENGKMAIVPDLASTYGFGSTEFHVLRPHEDVDPRFIYYAVSNRTFRFHAEHNMTGAVGQKRVPAAVFKEHEIGLPPPNEQLRIGAKIDELFSELDEAVARLKQARTQLAVYRQSVLRHAFEGKLTAQWRAENKDKLETPEQLLARITRAREARYEQQLEEWQGAIQEWEENGKPGRRPARPRTPNSVSTMTEEELAHLKSLPRGWLWLTAESVGIVQLGRQRSPRNRSKDYPTKYIRAANITEKGLDLDDVLDMNFLPHELSAYRLEKGDLVLSEASGSAKQVGKPAIWDDQIPNCCFQNTVIRHRLYCRDDAIYLLWLYRFLYVSGKFARIAGGVGINHLSAFKFAQIALPLCSVVEQQEIVRLLEERFRAIECREREIDLSLRQTEMLRQAILKRAYSGHLVAQDPNDEPASVLLDRIKVERMQKAKSRIVKRRTRKKRATE